ncbi:MAG: hypothetical protein ACK4VK_07985 [Aquificaceae bacterium]
MITGCKPTLLDVDMLRESIEIIKNSSLDYEFAHRTSYKRCKEAYLQRLEELRGLAEELKEYVNECFVR